jgi:hypothetical protein
MFRPWLAKETRRNLLQSKSVLGDRLGLDNKISFVIMKPTAVYAQ